MSRYMLKVQFVSDLHLEYRNTNQLLMIRPVGHILVLAGDIVNASNMEEMSKFVSFLEHYSKYYKFIFHVAGNHEFYSTNSVDSSKTITDCLRSLKHLNKRFSNYHLLDRSVFRFEENGNKYAVIGATLWTGFPKEKYKEVEAMMNDYVYIWNSRRGQPNERLTAANVAKRHQLDTAFIGKEVSRCGQDEKIILITHHKPVADIPDDFTYQTDMTGKFLSRPIKIAIHGHTHEMYDRVVNGVRILSNPGGYFGKQETGFRSSWYVRV